MLHFFRRIRRDLLANSQFFKYLKYAVGEIVLVVLGILIALYINNQNEKRKEQEKFNMALVDCEKEIIGNVQRIRNRVQDLNIQDSLALKYYIDSVKFENYVYYLRIAYPSERIAIRNESIEMLSKYNDISETQDSLIGDIISLYRLYHELHLTDFGETFVNRTTDISESFKKYDWYNSWIANQLSTDESFLDFVLNDPEYRKMFMQSFSWASRYRWNLGYYERRAISVYAKIFKHLEDNKMRHSDSLLFQYNASDYEHYLGKYESMWCSDKNYIHDDSVAVKVEDGKLYWYGYRSDGPDTRVEIIPMNKYRFRDERMFVVYHLQFDDAEEVEGVRLSLGPSYILDLKKIH